MNHLNIEATETAPRISFNPDTRIFEITGESRPENVREFYEPIIKWLDDYGKEIFSVTDIEKNVNEKISLRFNFRLGYFNSSSAKFIHDILKKIIELFYQGIDIKIYWYYEEGDEDMQDAGEDLSEMINFPFNYIEIQE